MGGWRNRYTARVHCGQNVGGVGRADGQERWTDESWYEQWSSGRDSWVTVRNEVAGFDESQHPTCPSSR